MTVDARRARLVQEQVGERVRQMAREREQPVVRVRVDRHRHGAERGDEAVQRAGSGPASVSANGRQEPGRALEELRARVLRAARLRAADRMAADEANAVGDGRADAAFVEPTSVTVHALGLAASVAATSATSVATGAATTASSAPSTASSRRGAARSTAPRSARDRERAPVRIPARDALRRPRGFAASPTEAPISPVPTMARRASSHRFS